MVVKYLAGERLIGTAAERAAMSTAAVTSPDANSYKELGTRVESSSGTIAIMSVASLPAKDNLMYIWYGTQNDTNGRDPRMNFDGDGKGTSSSSNYSNRYHNSFDTTGGNSTGDDNAVPMHSHFHKGFGVFWARNISSEVKSWWGMCMGDNSGGGDSITSAANNVGNWHDEAGSINEISFDRQGSSTGYLIGSPYGLIVLGADNTESTASQSGVAATPFWQELASATQSNSSAQSVLNSGTIAAKKFLWVQAHIKSTGSSQIEMTINETGHTTNSGSNSTIYTTRYNNNYGDGGGTLTASRDIRTTVCSVSGDIFINCYILNLSTRHKCFLGNSVTAGSNSSSGSGDEPENIKFFAKAATNTQATSIQIVENDDNDYIGQNSTLRVWGSD